MRSLKPDVPAVTRNLEVEDRTVLAGALRTSWVRLRLEFVVDADRAVMVGNNGNSDMRCTLAITGARRFRPAGSKDGHQRFSVNAGLGKGRKTRDGIATKHSRRCKRSFGYAERTNIRAPTSERPRETRPPHSRSLSPKYHSNCECVELK